MMWKVQRPATTSIDSFRTSISRISNDDLKNRLESIEAEIVQASAVFEAGAAAVTLHTFVETDGVAGIVTTKEMVDVYDLRFARKRSPGRAIYDAIREGPLHARCPLCGNGTVWTLDHHLPKTGFPALAVAPLNLIPACMECNKFKLAATPHNAEDETLHPYFDDVEDDRWLAAEVVELQPAAVRFSVHPPVGWSPVLAERVRRHFAMLKLAYRYGVEAGRELANLEKLLKGLFAKAGIAEVRRHLLDVADTHESTRRNSWQTAMYKALADCDWYCGGGFILQP
jgi:hypothetical protein